MVRSRPLKVQKISSGLYDGSHVVRQLSVFQPIFPYISIEDVQTSKANNSSTIGPNDLDIERKVKHIVLYIAPE